ncbi:hypothetical protein PENTCL1PPCAC_3556 [Pristionchus entomophagus]|uniref:G protein-coupled receptor n=1 Tax=Pristionchus entomophagus TaxID=358040 RepID=A0AAV5SEU6_9BILA|nr:hypothetical protein PENTCL1PPCAC_3556 [Pristionchus entomophagus]
MNDSQCLIVYDLSENIAYQIIVAFKISFCFTAAFRLSTQWKDYGVRFLVHDNTKVLFRFYFALNIFHSLVFGVMYISELIRVRYEFFLIDFRFIILTRGIGASAIFAAHHVILVISFERLYSSIFPAHFERSSSKLLSGFLAIMAVITSCVAFSYSSPSR